MLTYLSTSRLRLQSAGNIALAAKTEMLAEAAIAIALLEAEKAAARRVATSPLLDGTPRFCSLPHGALAAIAVEDEAGKIDLNAASHEFLANAFNALGISKGQAVQLATSVVNFRSVNTNDLNSEDRAYRSDGRPFGPRKALFQSIFELDQVIGVPPDLMRSLRPYLTVHSLLPEPDMSVAPPALFAALTGAPASEVEALNIRPYPNALDRPSFPAQGSAVAAMLVHAEVRTQNSANFVREVITATKSATDGRFAIKEWRGGISRFRSDLDKIARDGRSIPPC